MLGADEIARRAVGTARGSSPGCAAGELVERWEVKLACVDAREDLQPLRAEMSRAGAWVIASDVLWRHVPGGDVVDGGGVARGEPGGGFGGRTRAGRGESRS